MNKDSPTVVAKATSPARTTADNDNENENGADSDTDDATPLAEDTAIDIDEEIEEAKVALPEKGFFETLANLLIPDQSAEESAEQRETPAATEEDEAVQVADESAPEESKAPAKTTARDKTAPRKKGDREKREPLTESQKATEMASRPQPEAEAVPVPDSEVLAEKYVEEEDGNSPGIVAKVLLSWTALFGIGGEGASSNPKAIVTVSQDLPDKNAQGKSVGESVGDDLSTDAGWAVRDVSMIQIPPPVSPERRQALPPRPSLINASLTLGKTVRLGVLSRQRRENADYHRRCIKKQRDTVVFCIVPVDWPDKIKKHFLVSTVMYDGTKAIVRYDDERATHFHTLFDSAAFDAIVKYYTKRFGKPTETWARRMVRLAAPAKANPTVLWRSVEPATNLVTTLEIRQFDDARGGFPDLRRGAIMLYHTWSSPIFPEISHLELMMAR